MLGVLHGAGAAGDCNVHVVGVNVGLAGVPVRGGGHFGDQPGRGHLPVREPERHRDGRSGDQGDVQSGLFQGLADAALRGGLVFFHVAGSQHSRRGCHTRAVTQPRSRSWRRMNTLDVGSMITRSPQRGWGRDCRGRRASCRVPGAGQADHGARAGAGVERCG